MNSTYDIHVVTANTQAHALNVAILYLIWGATAESVCRVQAKWRRPSAWRRRRRAGFCCRWLKAGAAERAMRFAVHAAWLSRSHRRRPSSDRVAGWAAHDAPWPACADKASELFKHSRPVPDRITRRTSLPLRVVRRVGPSVAGWRHVGALGLGLGLAMGLGLGLGLGLALDESWRLEAWHRMVLALLHAYCVKIPTL